MLVLVWVLESVSPSASASLLGLVLVCRSALALVSVSACQSGLGLVLVCRSVWALESGLAWAWAAA